MRRSARARARANEAYIHSIVKARQSGATFAVIARAANVSSQAVQEIVRRHGAPQQSGRATVTDIERARHSHARGESDDRDSERTAAAD
ncbi:hypothetical protein GCM10027079_18940 [Sediminivirga luteola]|uniref:Uncharacterized protein n=1 Tax=Sediminivirga luteola TaxID=1774748 RepID=A0A8J2XJL8_9MICO|nr:hypothetical protein GCM10011333_06410 [Sediminivirga luteola]